MYDLIIVGLGPAGATLARLIGKKFKVLVLDKRELLESPSEGLYEKCCGGLLAPDAQEMLAKYGLGLPKEVMVNPQLFAVRTIDIQNSLESYYQRHYINIDREKFDRWVVSLIPDSVDIHCGTTFKSFDIQEDRVKVVFSCCDQERTEYAKVLVGADGALSTIRKQIKPLPVVPKTYISIQEWFEVDEISPFFSAIFDEEITDFYSWIIPKENLLIVGTALDIDANVNKKFELLKKKLTRYNYSLDKSVKRKGAYLLRPVKMNQIFISNDKVALIGEAAGFISPSSAEGLSYAFRSAFDLAKAFETSLASFSKEYDINSKSLKRNILMKNLKCPLMYNANIRKMIINSGLKTMKILTP